MSYSLETLRGDVFGGLTAAVVALPLSLAFGVASGLGAVAGLSHTTSVIQIPEDVLHHQH